MTFGLIYYENGYCQLNHFNKVSENIYEQKFQGEIQGQIQKGHFRGQFTS